MRQHGENTAFVSFSERELALLLKDSNTLTDEIASYPDEEILRGDQYESLWTEFLASLHQENNQQQDEQPKSIPASTEDEDNDDDPEFRLAETDDDVEAPVTLEHLPRRAATGCDRHCILHIAHVYTLAREHVAFGRHSKNG